MKKKTVHKKKYVVWKYVTWSDLDKVAEKEINKFFKKFKKKFKKDHGL